VTTTLTRLSDRSLDDEGLGSSIAAPRGSLRSSLSHRVESNDTGHSVDIIEGGDADRAADVVEGGAADAAVDVATVADNAEILDTDVVPDSEGLLT